MSEYEQSFSDKVTPYVAGFGLYYFLSWMFIFYPAFVIALSMKRLFFGISGTEAALFGVEGEGGSYMFGLFVMVMVFLLINILIKTRQYFIVLMIYLLTLWPFLYMLRFWWDTAGEMDTPPIPLDFWPLW